MPNDPFFPEEPTEPNGAPRFSYRIVITVADVRNPEEARMIGIPSEVFTLPALAWHAVLCIWRHRRLLSGKAPR